MAEPPSIPHAWDLLAYSQTSAAKGGKSLAKQLRKHAARCPGFEPGLYIMWNRMTPDDVTELVRQGYVIDSSSDGSLWCIRIPTDIQRPAHSQPVVDTDADARAPVRRNKSLCVWLIYKTIMLATTLAMIGLVALVSIRNVAEIQAAAAFSRSIEQPLAAVDECAHIICAGCGHKHIAALRYVVPHRRNAFAVHFEMACAKCCKEYTTEIH